MKAVIYQKYGPPEVLQLIEMEKPKPGDNEVLVKVIATTVSAGVLWARTGKHPDSLLFTIAIRILFGITKPKKKILGYEFSGEVVSVGKDVKLFKKGDKVFGTTTGLDSGAYAEFVCIPEKWKQGVVAAIPENVTDEDAAAIPVGAMAALYLLDKAKIQKGQKILIYGASGSVGTFAVQIAKHYFGAYVTGVCSAANLELVRTLGADKVIDYTKDNFILNGQTYDFIFDAAGKLSASRIKNSLNKNGKYLTVKSPTKEKIENLNILKELVESGKIKPVIDKRYPLNQITEAHRYTEQGHKKGNVLILMNL